MALFSLHKQSSQLAGGLHSSFSNVLANQAPKQGILSPKMHWISKALNYGLYFFRSWWRQLPTPRTLEAKGVSGRGLGFHTLWWVSALFLVFTMLSIKEKWSDLSSIKYWKEKYYYYNSETHWGGRGRILTIILLGRYYYSCYVWG